MRYGIFSDLHLEFRTTEENYKLLDIINGTDCDEFICAGDLHPSEWFREKFIEKIGSQVWFIEGNHDFYRSDLKETSWVDDERNMFGGTLWTDFGNDPVAEQMYCTYMNDFRVIKNASPQNLKDIHNLHVSEIFSKDYDVIVTHHAPSMKAIHPMYANEGPMNRSFVNDLDSKIEESKIKLWVFGHVHSKWDFMIGNCRCVANPLGYPNELYQTVDDYKLEVVEV